MPATDLATRTAHTVAGTMPTAVVAPTSEAEVVAHFEAWAQTGQGPAVVPWGTGQHQPPVAPARGGRDLIALDLSRLTGIVEFEPADLTVTVGAGTTLGTLQRHLAAANLWLPLDPPGGERATLGGIVAAGVSGAHRLRFGTPRDLLIGFRAVRADGLSFRGGAKVVKNVTGYDLPRLLAGSCGTLAVLTELTFKLQPRPPATATLAADFAAPAAALAATTALLATPLRPVACDLVPWGDGCRLLARFFDTPPALARASHSATLLCRSHGATGFATIAEAEVWAVASLAATWPEALVVRAGVLPTRLAAALDEIAPLARGWRAQAGSGIIHAALPSTDPLDRLREALGALGGSLVVTHAPAALPAEMVWGAPRADVVLMRALKQQFDPHQMLNPGRFVGGL